MILRKSAATDGPAPAAPLSEVAAVNSWGDDSPPLDGKPRPNRRQFLSAAACGGLLASGMAGFRFYPQQPPAMRGVLPGEFEHHDVLLLAWDSELAPDELRTLATVAAAAKGAIDVVMLASDDEACQAAERMMTEISGPQPHVKFVQMPISLAWVRDFGPLQIKSFDGKYVIVDTIYVIPELPVDQTPLRLAELMRLQAISAPIILQGGNLLSNGAGLCVTTNRTIDENMEMLGYDQRRTEGLLREYFGAREVVFLEFPVGEVNEHVDMFSTFTSSDTIVVGAYDPQYDPENAALLDRNAERLARVKTACGPLNVKRIPMPRRPDKALWWTYTNVVYANDVLLFPIYPGADRHIEAQARRCYQQLLPGWRIVDIDSAALLRREGGIHCATAHLYRRSDRSST